MQGPDRMEPPSSAAGEGLSLKEAGADLSLPCLYVREPEASRAPLSGSRSGTSPSLAARLSTPEYPDLQRSKGNITPISIQENIGCVVAESLWGGDMR